MSYTSKFTGAEIDTLLSSIGGTNIEETILWEGQTAPNVNNEILSLSQNIEQFDYVYIESGYQKSTGEYRYRTNSYFTVNTIKKNGYNEETEYQCDGFAGSASNGWAYASCLFISATSLKVILLSSATTFIPFVSKVVGIKLTHTFAGNVGESNPIGSILPIMGMEAPQDYLVCDGSELNISEYGALANYFEKQFGTKNHFGGDGINTFAIPDLRNEFLRGYGDLSGEIGEHQDATRFPNIFAYSYSNVNRIAGNLNAGATNTITKYDEALFDSTPNSREYVEVTASKYSNSTTPNEKDFLTVNHYTSRPTNVAVLFCIKYTESNTVSTKEKDYFHAYIEDNDGISASTNILLNPSAGWVFDYNRGFEYDDAGNVLLKANKTYEVSFNIERAKFSGNSGTLDLVLTIEDTQLIVTSLTVFDSGAWGHSGGGTRVITPEQDCYFTIKSTQWTGQNIFYIANISIREI